ncbi:MAG: DUF2924 domain-containing protein [Candidatus Omnitrophica bacterium]|nr:DUF2924 domain-containing protein [Candidatus Omnitrophota bacterium]
MKDNILNQILTMEDMEIGGLLAKYGQLFENKKPRSTKKQYLKKEIAYRLQESAHGGLSETAKTRLEQLIKVYDPINNTLLRKVKNPNGSKIKANRDRRLPVPGSIITKIYKGNTLKVKVLDKGFEYEGEFYKTLSQVASTATGNHWNGYLFFNL